MGILDCEIRTRLSHAGESDHWWTFANSDTEMADLVGCFKSRASLFFDLYKEFLPPFTGICMEEVDGHSELFPMMNSVRKCLLIACVFDHNGDKPRALEWAEHGLERVGRASALKDVFRDIAKRNE